RSVAARLGVPFHLARLESVDTSELGLEAAAREHRYRALDSLARAAGADRVATAHTRRDQAETVLLRLARGGGPGALAGIRRSRGGRSSSRHRVLPVPSGVTWKSCSRPSSTTSGSMCPAGALRSSEESSGSKHAGCLGPTAYRCWDPAAIRGVAGCCRWEKVR